VVGVNPNKAYAVSPQERVALLNMVRKVIPVIEARPMEAGCCATGGCCSTDAGEQSLRTSAFGAACFTLTPLRVRPLLAALSLRSNRPIHPA